MSSSDSQTINSNCLVIGGDITGLIIANILQRGNLKVTILDRSKEIGGHLATRRICDRGSIEGIFDYGIQSFSSTNPQFQFWVDDWLEHDVIKQWCNGFGDLKEIPCYCGVNGNNRIAQYLAKNLDINTNVKVTGISYEKKWFIETENNQQYQADMLVMTTPVPQSLSLLDSSLIPLPLEIRFSLEDIQYHRGIAVLALLEQPSHIPPPGCMSLENDSLAWLVDNHQKGISPHGYAVTLQATPQFSHEYWHSDDAEIAYTLLTAAADYLDSPLSQYQVHRWRYNLPKTFYSEPFLALLELPLVMAGDAFVSPTMEGSVISAMAAAELINQRFGVGRCVTDLWE